MEGVSIPVELELHDAAEAVGQQHGRTAAQQLEHWAELGRRFEELPPADGAAAARVLSGEQSYDSLSRDAAALVRVVWDARIEAGIATLDLRPELEASGLPWYSADLDGHVREHVPGGGSRRI